MKKTFFAVVAMVAFSVSGFANSVSNEKESSSEVKEKNNKVVVYDCCVATLYWEGKRVDSVERCFQGSFDNNCKKAEQDLLARNPDAKKAIDASKSLKL